MRNSWVMFLTSVWILSLFFSLAVFGQLRCLVVFPQLQRVNKTPTNPVQLFNKQMVNLQTSSFLQSSSFVGLSGFYSICLCQYCVNDLYKDLIRNKRNFLIPRITGLKMASIYSQIAILNCSFMILNEVFLVLIKLIFKSVVISSVVSLYHDSFR